MDDEGQPDEEPKERAHSDSSDPDDTNPVESLPLDAATIDRLMVASARFEAVLEMGPAAYDAYSARRDRQFEFSLISKQGSRRRLVG